MTSPARALGQALTGLVDLLVPRQCAGCGRTGTNWCAACATEFGFLRRLNRPLFENGPPTYALGRYRGAARRAVLQYKESGLRVLAKPFGEALATGLHAIAAGQPRTWWLVPAPSRALASRRRGGAHMLRIAEHTASVLSTAGWRASVADCLVLRRGVRDSVGLDPDERVVNLADHLAVRPDRLPPTAAEVVLLDDVITTGATVASCIRALDAASVEVVAALTLSATRGSAPAQ